MDRREETQNGEAVVVIKKFSGRRSPYRYSKEELLEIKEGPHSNLRPLCLLGKYDSDGVWDPEKWHASLYPSSGRSSPVEGFRKDQDSDRAILKRRIADPRERVKEDDLDVVLSPQRRSFGGGCHVIASAGPSSRRAGSPQENKENENLRGLGGRRIGSGRLSSSRGYERDGRPGDKDTRDARDRERDFKEKRFRRDFNDGKRGYGDRRRNDSYTEEEPEWFSAGPTSQSETIELIGFDDKLIEEDRRRFKRSRKRTDSFKDLECNGGVVEEEVEVAISPDAVADQEVPQATVLPEPAPGEFDFNEFFNLDKSVPGLASMIEDVLGEASVSASRFSQWFSSNLSQSGSRSSSLRSTPHEELERLAGLEQGISSPGQSCGNFFAPIQSESTEKSENKVNILEMLQNAKVDLKPLLSNLTANKEKLRESTHSGVVLSVEEVEAGLKGLKVESERKIATPFMAEQLEEALTSVAGSKPVRKRDGDMSAFNKLVNSMKESGTLPMQPNVHRNSEPRLLPPNEVRAQPLPQKNLLQIPRSISPNILSSLMGNADHTAALLGHRGLSPPVSQLFQHQPRSPDYLTGRIPSPIGFVPGHPVLADQFHGMPKAMSPVPPQQVLSPLEMQQAVLEGLSFPQELALHSGNFYHPGFSKYYLDKGRDGYRNRQLRMNRSPGPVHRGNVPSPAPASITSMLSPSFTPTSVIRKMYESKEKNREEQTAGKSVSGEGKDEGQRSNEETTLSSTSVGESADRGPSPTVGARPMNFQRSACSTPLSNPTRFTKDQDYRSKSAGRRTPTMASPVPGSPFLRPVCPVPLVPHVPLIRPTHPPIHPGVVQRMLAQGIAPQQLSPALVQAGILPAGVDLSHLQGIPPPILGQPFYPLLNPRPGNPLHLAMMQQQLQRPVLQTPNATAQGLGVLQSPNQNTVVRPGQRQIQRSGSPVGLAKWFGSDVLQQPLPSMPAKVISVDELEFRQ
ncbi:eukaryotic translation initiation factor 4E transporter isoform X2 [Latimeria chalumnae]|uniref:eukaryotic translation initiation factor 4E transporter isoform X2 n=1 Tax=Latimeria chalumnae TaxID=7897 RepID=UPI0003C16BF8|nr:PREDICTED: eukaryotic translation initiation factor 4E transporter isoform X2 [Latimeria chalumnae]|eukprot:XP_005987195.1 PREDICTED: eukaryotic translation initiation factor 4E transporter isoform X2 [Latimeria chalumnae]